MDSVRLPQNPTSLCHDKTQHNCYNLTVKYRRLKAPGRGLFFTVVTFDRRKTFTGKQTAALRTGSGTGTTGVSWLFGDHLGSQSITADASGNMISRLTSVQTSAGTVFLALRRSRKHRGDPARALFSVD
jgi:hypothetical protein